MFFLGNGIASAELARVILEVKIPSLGDIEQVEIVEICTAVGSEVKVGDALLVIESDKASVEVPSPCDGILDSLAVAVGDVVSEGAMIAIISTSDQTLSDDKDIPDGLAEESPENYEGTSGPSKSSQGENERIIDLRVPDNEALNGATVEEIFVKIDEQVKIDSVVVVLDAATAKVELPAGCTGRISEVSVRKGQKVRVGDKICSVLNQEVASLSELSLSPSSVITEDVIEQTEERFESARKEDVYAGPAVRRLARELGVDLINVPGSGLNGRISKEDVKNYVKSSMSLPSDQRVIGDKPEFEEFDFSKFGSVNEQPLTRIQKQVAKNMARNWRAIPHVTQHDDIDVTDLETFRKEMEPTLGKLSAVAFIVKAVTIALKDFPQLNASLKNDGETLVLKEYIHIGLAVNVKDGLLVPVIKNADQKGLRELSYEISRLADGARDGALSFQDFSGSSFTVSSLGKLGGTGFSPIINHPEVAILGVGRSSDRLMMSEGGVSNRKILPLSLSYDHRVINGVYGGEFMARISDVLTDVRKLSI